MKFFTKEIKIALVAIIAIIIIYLGIKFLKGMKLFDRSSSYYVELKDVSGLTVSSQVLADGFPVGIVSEMKYDYDSNGNVVIGISVDEDLKITAGSMAELSKELLGSTKLNLVIDKTSPYKLNVGDTIRGGWRTDALTGVGELIPNIKALMPKLDSILNAVNDIANNPSINASLNNAQYLTTNLRTTTDRLNAFLANDVKQLAAKANNIADDLNKTTKSVSEVDYKQIIDNINNTINEANGTIAELKKFTDKLNDANGTLQKLMNDPGLYNHLDATVNNANALVKDLKENPKRYVHFSVFGKKDKKDAQSTNIEVTDEGDIEIK